MHFDFIAEGWKPDLDAFEEWMNTRTFSIPMTYPDGSVAMDAVPGALRPRRFYTYVFPKAHLQAVINTLRPERVIGKHDGKGTPMLGKTADLLRMGLRLKKFPNIEKNGITFPLVKNNIRLLGLGYRDDIDITEKGITHEGL